MPIVSSEIIEDRPNGTERRNVTEAHTDNVGKIHNQRYSCPTVWDVDQELIDHAAQLDATLPTNESSEAAGGVEFNDPDVTPDYQTQADYDRRTLGFLMTETDSYILLQGLPFWQAVETRGGANANQRAAYLGVSRANYDLVSNRFGDVQGAANFLNDEKGQIWTEIPEEFQ